MSFHYEPVTYGEIKEGKGDLINKNTQLYKTLCQATHEDLRISDVFLRLGEKEKCFGAKIAWEENVLQTITAKLDYSRGVEKERISKEDIIHAQTFPEDYNFCSNSWHDIAYLCGMSVPPVMTKRIVTRLIESGLYNYKI